MAAATKSLADLEVLKSIVNLINNTSLLPACLMDTSFSDHI